MKTKLLVAVGFGMFLMPLSVSADTPLSNNDLQLESDRLTAANQKDASKDATADGAQELFDPQQTAKIDTYNSQQNQTAKKESQELFMNGQIKTEITVPKTTSLNLAGSGSTTENLKTSSAVELPVSVISFGIGAVIVGLFGAVWVTRRD
jgi:cobalamin biosynthesis Mg chelatase CobN